MKEILRLIAKYNYTIIFILVEILCFYLIVKYNNYQRVIFSQQVHSFFGYISSMTADTRNYFRLKKLNESLMEENTCLKNEIARLEQSEDTLLLGTFGCDSSSRFNYLHARIVNASFNRMKNYLTLDKGANDGILQDMAVHSPMGIVGLIQDMSEHYSIVLPLINVSSRVSAKIKKNNYYGSLQWDGNNYLYTYLKDIPYHVDVAPGDTIVTSGYSSIFPEGLLIGYVESVDKETANFLNIKVRIAVDFKCIDQVYVIQNKRQEEKRQLETSNYHE